MRYVKELQIKYVKRRVHKDSLKGQILNGPDEAGLFFVHLLGKEHVEKVVALYLDSHNIVVAYRMVAQGSVNSTPVPIAEIAKGALLANAGQVILAHNHPSGNLAPSTHDFAFAAKTKEALGLLDIKLVDFQIVNDETHRSIPL